ncbi:hypothetical protein Nepgr_033182 [Nepenthes gracilis]|uniref:1-phosphatidylinositol-3-phosphate 5-kinase n=1 Tax=Nepenthes gracilis TaxID=150966 RepID=A0AAD3TLK4_NEPGR|nr:hypothetical protein Nepgr_033182 [Nepenthes gracilis]
MCHLPVKSNEQMKTGNGNHVEADNGKTDESCKLRQVNPELGPTEKNGSTFYAAPVISSSSSLSTSDSFASSCSESSVEVYPNGREYQDEDGSNGHVERSSSASSVNGIDGSDGATYKNHKEGKDCSTLTDVEITGTNDSPEVISDHGETADGPLDEDNETSHSLDDEIHAQIWMPPEAENEEDDREDCVTTLDDDDDEFGDGTKWGKPSYLNSCEEGFYRSSQFKEEKQKAMEEVMNGKFRSLVNKMLKSVGVANSERDGESWVDIVTSLAWQAASFLKPDAIEGKTMDPTGYVKVKCIATGSHSQSQLIKGLVFKKNAAHKHMPTKFNNAKLLLIRGMLGQSSGLSSFNSMIPQDKNILKKDNLTDNLKPLIENLEACNPNVILVEKSVSRDVLEAIHKMGMTLIFDMKLHRLERVARCTGSPILSADIMLSQKLKQCDSFYIEKFIEEHAHVVDGEKKPRKTLMFIEGCPTRLGCTILLKGSHSEELKRIKCVVQCAVVMAYHFVLENSFLLDQKAMFSTILDGVANLLPTSQQPARIGSFNSIACHSETTAPTASGYDFYEGVSESVEKSNALLANQQLTFGGNFNSTASSYEMDIPICNGFHEDGSFHMEESTSKTSPPCGLDIPISNGDGFLKGGPPNMNLALEGKSKKPYEPHVAATSSGMSSISASLRKVIGESLPLVTPAAYQSMCTYIDLNERESDVRASVTDGVVPVEVPFRCDTEEKDYSNEEKFLNSESQLLAANSRATEHEREAVGDSEDCIPCKDEISSVLDSESILVLMSSRNASRGTVCEQSHFSHIKFYRNFDVPLGKFLRDNLLNQSLVCKTCGQLPEAHFYYYAHHNKQLTIRVKHLPNKIRLSGESDGKLWMWSRCGKCKLGNGKTKSTKRVLISGAARSLSFGKFLELSFSSDSSFDRFSSCGHSLHRDFLHFFGLGPMVAIFRYSPVATYTVSVPHQKLEFDNSIKDEWLKKETVNVYTKGMLVFTEVANYLKKIKSRFSGITLNIGGSRKEFSDIEEMVSVERNEFEENIKSIYIDNGRSVRNLLSLNQVRRVLLFEAWVWCQRLQLLHSSDLAGAAATSPDDTIQGILDSNQNTDCENKTTQATADDCIDNAWINGAKIISNDGHKASENGADIEVQVEIVSGSDEQLTNEIPHKNIAETVSSSQDFLNPENLPTDPLATNESGLADTVPMHSNNNEVIITDQDVSSFAEKNASEKAVSSQVFNFEKSKGWVWNPFSEILRDLLTLENSLKFKPHHPLDFMPAVSQVILEEGSRLQIRLSDDNYCVLDYEGEISSIIACALALMEDLPTSPENLDEVARREKYNTDRYAEGPVGLPRAASAPSPHWSSSVSSDSDAIHPSPSMSLESRLSSFDGLNLLDSLVSFGALHPEVPLGIEKYFGKGKYSVTCMYEREFRGLRNRCCPSELDYIASLSRCRIWDAKGGKSKSFFAKTLDDRLIIKEIKKTEFESFMEFAPDYFSYMNESFDKGNQTCLAKILGIYQVTIRQTKSGKEMKHDLMVMENLSFGRNITRQYDLKGALHARFAAAADGSGDVLLDQNFVIDMNASPIYVGQKAKRLLQRAVWNDTTFLNSINVMDYSLLVGVDQQRRELVCGIIDYLRQYTWDKQLETWVKSSLVVPRNQLPTIISPKEYKKRFRKFMDTHFLTVPDHWCSHRSSNPCKLCGIQDYDSPRVRHEKNEELDGI